MVGDKIANLINGLKTASAVGKATTEVSSSKIGVAILELLKKENYIEDFNQIEGNWKNGIEVSLKYEDGEPAIHDLKRVSKLSCRRYQAAKDIRPVRRGYGMLVITTSKGVMKGEEARKKNLGGEVLFEIW